MAQQSTRPARPAREHRAHPPTKKEREAHAEEVKADTDALLDEIDACLEDNALETVQAYRQKGGE